MQTFDPRYRGKMRMSYITDGYDSLAPHLRQARVQSVAQRVAEKIEAHQRKENEKSR